MNLILLPAEHVDYAVKLVSPVFNSPRDATVIHALLDIAAGETPEPIAIDARQCELLDEHRVLTLVPITWSVPDPGWLAQQKQQLLAKQMLLLSEASKAVAHLTAAGIESRVLKGVASCSLDYVDASTRSFADVDLLVQESDFTAAITQLKLLGASPGPVGRAGYEFSSEATLTLSSGSEVDLHYRLLSDQRSDAQLDTLLFANPQELSWGGVALGAELRLAHAAIHFLHTAPGKRRLSGLADISAIRARQDVDLDVTRSLAQAIGVEAIVGRALAIERTLRGLPVDTDHWQQPSRLERASFVRGNRQLLMEHLLTLSRLDGAGPRWRYLTQGLLPTPGQAAVRGGYAQYFRRALLAGLADNTGPGRASDDPYASPVCAPQSRRAHSHQGFVVS